MAITIYHLRRSDGTSFFLHPFRKTGSTLDIDRSTEVVGRYGVEPRVESLTQLRNDLYRRIEDDVRGWINERRFIPRFLAASAVFLVVYLFLSLVVRDPLPVVDEILIGLGLAVVVYILVGRRFEQSRVAADRRIALRAKIDGVVFSQSPFVVRLEQLFQQLEEANPDGVAHDEGIRADAAAIRQEFPEDTARIIADLRTLLSLPQYRNLEKQMKRGRLTGKTAEAVEHGTLVPAAVLLLRVLQGR
ncbi:MAG: hypothetical protein ACLFSV_14295 [Alkalispirochaeta sp.]